MTNDYDDDGNNIVPCPICLNVHCASKEGGKCPEEDEFVRANTNRERGEELVTVQNALAYFEAKLLKTGWAEQSANEAMEVMRPILINFDQNRAQALKDAREEAYQAGLRSEREKWKQRLPEDMFSVTIEGRSGERIYVNRKFVTTTAIAVTSGRKLLLEAEACAVQALTALSEEIKK